MIDDYGTQCLIINRSKPQERGSKVTVDQALTDYAI